MARKPRVEYPGAVYHVMSRGDRQNNIFYDDRDRELFLKTLEEVCVRQGWRIHAFVLMDNHYHVLLETPEPNLVAGMKWLQGTYTQRFNTRHRECGHLFQGRYKALIVQPDAGDYFSMVASYIHLNPARARVLDFEKQKLSDFRWSSYPLYLRSRERPEWFCAERVLHSYGWADDRSGRALYRYKMDRRVIEVICSKEPMEFDAQWKKIRRGWCLGDGDFRERMESLVDERISTFDRRSYLGEAARKHDETEALRYVKGGLELFNLSETDLNTLKKNDSRKRVIAWYVRRHTGVKNDWICERLAMGRSSNLARHVSGVEETADKAVVKMREMMKEAF